MSLLERISSIIKANLNEVVEQMENPELMLNQLIRDLEQSIVEMRQHLKGTLAAVRLTQNRLEKYGEEQQEWQKNAELAVAQGQDDLARRALAKKRDLTATIESQERQLAGEEDLARQVREQLKLLEDKTQEARAKRETLITKKRLSDHQEPAPAGQSRSLEQAEEGIASAQKVINGLDRIEQKLAEKVEDLEARQRVEEELTGASLKNEIDSMKREQDIEEALAALREKVGKKKGGRKKGKK